MDIKKALLSIRNTPLSCGQSPAELLMNRTLRDNMPSIPTLADTNQTVGRDLIKERTKQKQQHDKNIHSKSLQQQLTHPNNKFRPGQQVAIQDHVTKEWSIRGRILRQVAPRSFEVQVHNKGILRRNQQQLRKVHSTASYQIPNKHFSGEESEAESDTETVPYDIEDEDLAFSEEEAEDNHNQVAEETITTGDVDSRDIVVTKSGRVVKGKRPTDYDNL